MDTYAMRTARYQFAPQAIEVYRSKARQRRRLWICAAAAALALVIVAAYAAGLRP